MSGANYKLFFAPCLNSCASILSGWLYAVVSRQTLQNFLLVLSHEFFDIESGHVLF